MRTKPITKLTALFLLASTPVIFNPMRAEAQQTSAADDAVNKAARARFQEGVDFFDKGQFEQARAAFKQAFALKSHPSVLINLAESSLKSGHALEAAKYFAQYLKDPNAPADKRPEAEKGLSDARGKIGRLDVQAANGAEVSLDNEKVGFAPLGDALDVEPGTHTVRVKGADGTSEQRVMVAAGQLLPVKFGAPPVVTPVVTPTPVAPTDSTVAPPVTPPPIVPDATLAPPMVPDAGADTTPHKKDWAAPPANIAPLFVFGGIAIAGAITTIVFAAENSAAKSSAASADAQIRSKAPAFGFPGGQGVCKTPPTPDFVQACNTLKSDQNASNTDNAVAIVGGVVTGVAVVAGIIYYFAAPKKHQDSSPPPAAVIATPWLGSGTAGASLRMTF